MHPIVSSLFVVVTLCVSACTSDPLESWHGPLQSVGVTSQHRLLRSTDWVLTHETRLYVVMPEGEQFDAAVYKQLVARFSRYYHHTQAGVEHQTLAAAFVSARQASFDVVVYPLITRRQSRQVNVDVSRGKVRTRDTQSGHFDMDLSLYTVSAEQKVDQIQFESRAGAFTADEEALLWKPLDAYLRQLSQY